MSATRRLCVFCGSSLPPERRYRAAATALGAMLGPAGIELVYGGGRIGLMGLVADAALASGARVTGIIPASLHDREVAHPGLSALEIVHDMHERKRRMFELADAVVVLPGGLGTLDEAFEAITLRQLGVNDKQVTLLNLDGFWDPLLALIERVIERGFAAPGVRTLYQAVSAVEEVIPSCFPEGTGAAP
jgi:uncharacterized protein (TIGR00730 family)